MDIMDVMVQFDPARGSVSAPSGDSSKSPRRHRWVAPEAIERSVAPVVVSENRGLNRFE